VRVDELADASRECLAHKLPFPLVELTGGEPLLQEENLSLCGEAPRSKVRCHDRDQGRAIHRSVAAEVIKIVDVKCPDSGEPDTFEIRNWRRCPENDEVKFVLFHATRL